MKSIVCLASALFSIAIYANIDSEQVVNTFSSDLNNIKIQLQNGSMTPAQASVLLQVIQARQNNVIIQKNQELIDSLSKSSPSNKSSS